MTPRLTPRLIVITPEGVDEAKIHEIVAAGARSFPSSFLLQARAKSSLAELRRVALAVADAASRHGLPFSVNGSLPLAEELEAPALHVPARSSVSEARMRMQHAWISSAAHSDAEVRRAVSEGADAVLVSPIFAVPGKGEARGTGALESALLVAGGAQVVALGGVSPGNARACLAAGADAVAVSRALFAADDPSAVYEALYEALRAGFPRRSPRC